MSYTENTASTANNSSAQARTAHETDVQTILSQQAITDLEITLRYFWDYIDEGITGILLKMISVYIANPPTNEGVRFSPSRVCLTISYLVEVCEQFRWIVEREKVGNWINTVDGYKKPVE